MRINLAVALFSLALFPLSPMRAHAGETISISAVGDIMMGTTYPKSLLPPNDGEGIFDGVSGLFAGSDIVFGNLEGPLTDRGRPAKCKGGENCYEFRTPARYIRHLKAAGFNVLNIANNHTGDFGPEGIGDTIEALGLEGIRPVGGEEIAFMEAKGKKIAVLGFSFSDSSHSLPISDITRAEEAVKRLKAEGFLVIVSFHGGAEGKTAQHVPKRREIFLGEDRGDVFMFSHAVVDAGADVVLGHGPHVLRAVEIYKGKLIAYSLGNFLTYERFNISGPNGLSVVLKADIDPETGDFIKGILAPVRLVNGGIPEADPDAGAVGLISRLTSEDISPVSLTISETGEIALAASKGLKTALK